MNQHDHPYPGLLPPSTSHQLHQLRDLVRRAGARDDLLQDVQQHREGLQVRGPGTGSEGREIHDKGVGRDGGHGFMSWVRVRTKTMSGLTVGDKVNPHPMSTPGSQPESARRAPPRPGTRTSGPGCAAPEGLPGHAPPPAGGTRGISGIHQRTG